MLRARILFSLLVSAVFAVGGAMAMMGPQGPGAHVAAGLVCCAVPMTALSGWRLLRRWGDPAELGPLPMTGQLLHLASWTGIVTGSGVWLLAAATLAFESKGGFWMLGALGVAVGGVMTTVTAWSISHPFPILRAGAAGFSVGGALPVPWPQIARVAWRRSAWRFPCLEVTLASGERLQAQVAATTGPEDLARFMAEVARHTGQRSEPVGLAQAIQQP